MSDLELDLEPLYEDDSPETFGAVPSSLSLKSYQDYSDLVPLIDKENKLYHRETISID